MVWDALGWTDPDRRDGAIDRLLHNMGHPTWVDRPLTAGELKIVTALSHGLGDRGAADLYGLSYETVRTQNQHARRKMRAKTAAHLVGLCLRARLID